VSAAPDRASGEPAARAPAPSERTPGETTPSERPASRRFDDRFLRKLESLVLAIRRTSSGRMHGGRRSRRVGAGLELADHRDYAPGDDLRYLDWNLYGRLGRRALRLYEEDEDLSIDVLVDASASMALGAPAKLELALQLGAALSYVGLANLDRVAVTALDADRTGPPASRGKGRILPILRFLDGVEAVGRASLTTAVRAFLSRRCRGRRGLVVLISDFYDRAGAPAALELIRRHRLQTIAIQVSAPDELSPSIRGDVRLRDAETGAERDLTVSPGVLAAYRRRHAAWLRELEGHCRERAIPCVALSSSEPFDAVVLRMFRAGGLLR
jgi:uncharacterized protein (DUF58 family)